MIKHPHTVTFTLNGELKTFITRPDEKLLDLLRREGYKGTKYGCGQGTCGACTVLMDGRAVYACLLFAMQAENRNVRTIESVGTHEKPSEFQQELIRLQEAVMAQQDKQIQRIKPTLFGAYIGGLVSGAILATVIGAYILWVQG